MSSLSAIINLIQENHFESILFTPEQWALVNRDRSDAAIDRLITERPDIAGVLERSIGIPVIHEELKVDRDGLARVIGMLRPTLGPGVRTRWVSPVSLEPREGSLSPSSPYRYYRNVPATGANVAAADADWRAVLNENDLRRETLRTRSLSPQAAQTEAVKRLGILEQEHYVGMTFCTYMIEAYEFLFDYFQHGSFERPFHAATFGAGRVDFESERHNWYNFALREIAKQHNLPVSRLSFEAPEFLVRFLSAYKFGKMDVFEKDPATVATLQLRPFPFMIPFFSSEGTPYSVRGPNMKYASKLAQQLGATQSDIHQLSPDNKLYDIAPWVEPSPMHGVVFRYVADIHLNKMNVFEQDIGTELLASARRYSVALYLQTAYFLDPLLQRAAFIKILNQVENKGVLVSDYLLTDAEAETLGVSIRERIEMIHPGERPEMDDERDRFLYIYVKEEETALARDLMAVVEKVQRVTPETSGGMPSGGPRVDLAGVTTGSSTHSASHVLSRHQARGRLYRGSGIMGVRSVRNAMSRGLV